MKKNSTMAVLFTVIMLACVMFIVWYLPAVSQRRFQLVDVQKSLETSLGRERKQQSEYDETVASMVFSPLYTGSMTLTSPESAFTIIFFLTVTFRLFKKDPLDRYKQYLQIF